MDTQIKLKITQHTHSALLISVPTSKSKIKTKCLKWKLKCLGEYNLIFVYI